MKLHRRTFEVNEAHLEASRAIAEIWQKRDLTWGEIIAFHASELQSAGKYIIREERHPLDPSQKGDEAGIEDDVRDAIETFDETGDLSGGRVAALIESLRPLLTSTEDQQ